MKILSWGRETGVGVGRRRQVCLFNYLREGHQYATSWAEMPGYEEGVS